VTHAIRFDEICHVWLIQHPDSGDLRVIGHPNTAYAIIARSCDFSGATSTMALIKMIIKEVVFDLIIRTFYSECSIPFIRFELYHLDYFI
jgi:hypothetical protein